MSGVTGSGVGLKNTEARHAKEIRVVSVRLVSEGIIPADFDLFSGPSVQRICDIDSVSNF